MGRCRPPPRPPPHGPSAAQKARSRAPGEPELAGRAVANACTRRHWPPPAPRNGVRAVGLAMAWATARTPDHATHLGGRQNPPASQRRRRSTAELLSVPGLFSRSTPGIAFFSAEARSLCRSAVFEGPPLRIALCIKGARVGRRHTLAHLPAPECPSGHGPGAATRSPRRRPTAATAFTAELAWPGQETGQWRSAAANVRAGAPAPGRAPRGERAGRGRPPLRSRGQSY